MRHILTFAIMVVIGLACQRSTESTKVISSREYAVYRFLVTHFDDSTRYAAVFVSEGTLRPERSGLRDAAFEDSVAMRFPSYFETTDLEVSKILLDSLHFSPRIRLGSSSGFRTPADTVLFMNGKLLVLGFSRVAFDSTGNEALLYVVRRGGPLDGHGSWYWLTRSAAGWTVYKSHLVWVS